MSIVTLQLGNYRNFEQLELNFSSGLNIISGHNGSGKTSILEAIYFLTHGRSFRTSAINRIIRHEQDAFTLYGLFEQNTHLTTQAGVVRTRNGDCRIKVNGTDNCTLVDLINIQPLLLLNPSTFQLLDAGPLYRRQFIDWGLFHVEHQFLNIWRRTQRILKQRNAALKRKDTIQQARIWDNDFVTNSERLNELRKNYLEQLKPVFLELVSEITDYQGLSISYAPGWDETVGLAEVLEKSFERDSLLGYTQYGPQKADIILKCKNVPVIEVFSRGEQKLLVYALRLAQGILLQTLSNKICSYLIDDLAAELDEKNQKKLFQILAQQQAQVIVTAVESNPNFLSQQQITSYTLDR